MRLPALLTCLCLLASLPAAQVHVTDGRVLEGAVRIHEDGRVDVTVRSGGITGTIHLAADQVLAIDHSASPRSREIDSVEMAYRALGPEPDGDAVWALALRLQELEDPIAFRRMAERCIAAEPDHAEARAALDHVKHEGEWMTVAEANRAKGLLFHGGRWITRAEYDRVEAERRERLARLAERRAQEARLATERAAARVPRPVVVGVHSSVPVWHHGMRDTVMNRYWPVFYGPSLSPYPAYPRAVVPVEPVFRAGFHLERDDWSLDLSYSSR